MNAALTEAESFATAEMQRLYPRRNASTNTYYHQWLRIVRARLAEVS